jgi:hypothetical protein
MCVLQVYVSGGIPLSTNWKPYDVVNGSWIMVENQNDVNGGTPGTNLKIFGKLSSWEECQTACQTNTSVGVCTDWTWHDANQGQYAFECWFRCAAEICVITGMFLVKRKFSDLLCRLDNVWDLVPESGHYSGYKTPGKNIYVTDLSGQVTTVPGLRQNGLRMIRARCVNLPLAACSCRVCAEVITACAASLTYD